MLSRLTLALSAAAVLSLTGCGGSAQEQSDAALEDALAKSLEAANGVGHPNSIALWTESFDRVKAEQQKEYPTPPEIAVKGEYLRTACTLLRTDLPVAGGPTGTKPVDPRTTFAKAGILTAFADQQKNEDQADVLNAVVNSAIRDWRGLTEQNVPLPNDPFGPMTDVCLGKPLPILSDPSSAPTAPSDSPEETTTK